MSVCPAPLRCDTSYGRLEILVPDGYEQEPWSLHTGAWCAHDLSPLYEDGETRGQNPTVEILPGRPARPVVDDETEVSLRMMFSGAVDRHGDRHVDPTEGLFRNLADLRAAIVEPIRAGVASLPARLHRPDGLLVEAPVQPLRLREGLLPGGYARAVLELRLPSGGFRP